MPGQTFTISAATVPAAPTSLAAVPVQSTTIRLTWLDNATNETSYKVLRRTGSNPFAVLSGAASLPAGTTTFADTLCAANTTYDYQVIASNAQGDSAPSNTATATTPATGQPVGLTALPLVPTPLYQWIDPTGTVHDLSTPGAVAVLLGVKGLLMPSVTLVEQQTPFTDGSRITNVRMPPRDVDVPLLVEAADVLGLREQLRNLARWFDPHQGDGTLRITVADGAQRDLFCRYTGGLESATDDIQEAGPNWWALALTLHAADPYFYAVTDQTVTFTTAAPLAFFPFFPLRLSASNVVGATTMTNDGDVEAWPVWTVQGPATSLVLTNTTTGAAFTLTATLATGDVLVIDTRPGRKSVLLTSGTVTSNLLGSVTAASVLWSLAPGRNALSIALGGSAAASSVGLAYTERFLTV